MTFRKYESSLDGPDTPLLGSESPSIMYHDAFATADEDIISVQINQRLGGQVKRIAFWHINTRDQLIRQELIRMGWTPPDAGARTPETS